MTTVATRYCDVCGRVITGRHVELRAVAVRVETDGRTTDHMTRAETCSPACTLRAARAAIDRAWTIHEGRVLA